MESRDVEEQSQGFPGVQMLAILRTQALALLKVHELASIWQAPRAFLERMLISQRTQAGVRGSWPGNYNTV